MAVTHYPVRQREATRALRARLDTERDHWRTLQEATNALVSELDLNRLLASISPTLRQLVAHETASLMLIDPEDRLGPFVFDRELPAGTAEILPSLNLADLPFAQAVTLGQPVDVGVVDLASLPRTLREYMRSEDVHRVCFIPLVTPRRTLGGLALARTSTEPLAAVDLARLSQSGKQIAIAIENALAYKEIATLKERLAQENLYLEDEIRGSHHFDEIVGDGQALKRALAQARSVADTDTTVLLLGETGTGKELIARAIHSMSDRRGRALVTVNCAASPAGLLESEWFGYEKGAFTGAIAQKVGRFELAHQGTLFLDEVGDVPLDLQAKLLRVLQEHEIERLGSTRTLRVDFRLVAATNRHLEEMVVNREYRSDLFYRLNVFPIRIPPLRERREDIPPLVRYFVQRYAKRLRRRVESIPRETMDALTRWHWPGNVRELQNVVERAVILSDGPSLRVSLSELGSSTAGSPHVPITLEDAERAHILDTLEGTGWVIGGPGGAAMRLGVKRTTLVSTMRRLGIVRPLRASHR